MNQQFLEEFINFQNRATAHYALPMPRISPQDYTLDNFRLRDFGSITRIAADPAFFYAYLNQNRRHPYWGTLRFMWLCCWTRWRRPRHWIKAIRATTTNRLCGCVLILDLHVVEKGLGEIAYFIAPEAQNQGLGSVAVVSTVRWAYRHHGLRRLHANVDPDNHASIAILQKLGMQADCQIAPLRSGCYDRNGNPRPRLISACSPETLATALATLPATGDLTVR